MIINIYTASLLAKSLTKSLSKTLGQIRREAYNQGWKDKAAKVRKKTEFWDTFYPDDVGD